MSQSIPSPSDCCQPCESPEVQVIPGPQGPPGADGTNGTDGQSAFTLTTSAEVQPAVDDNITVDVENSEWAGVGEDIFLEWGGYYLVIAKPTTTSITIQNRGYDANTPPGFAIPIGSRMSSAGEKGEQGTPGSSADVPLTTKGDLLTRDATMNVRHGVGSNGQVIAADSAQADGLNWVAVQPNTVVADGNIARYDGTAGKPVPLQDSKMILTDNGALQSTGSGGNARGADAVDLQVVRTLATEVASGSESVVAGGERNTASGIQSTVGGGALNTASDLNTTVGGGTVNIASNDYATVGGGDGNTASGVSAVVAGGHSNNASGRASIIGGGKNNAADAECSVVAGGFGAYSYLFGQISHANGQFANPGDAQAAELVWFGATTNATPKTLYLDNSALPAAIGADRTWVFQIHTVGRDDNGASAAWQTIGAIKLVAGTTSLVAAVTHILVAADAASIGAGWGIAGAVVVSADNGNDSLKIEVTGAALTNIRWVAHARIVEVLYFL